MRATFLLTLVLVCASTIGLSPSSAAFAAQEAIPATNDAVELPLAAGDEEDAWTPIIVSAIDPETAAVRGTDGRYHVVYELVLTNTGAEEATLDALSILDATDGAELMRLSGEDLVANEVIRTLNRAPAKDNVFPANAARVLMLTIDFADAGEVPAALSHQLDVTAMGSFSVAPEPFRYRAGIIDLTSRPAVVVAPPLQGEGWIAAEGCCSPESHHRNGIFPINGSLYAGQRFAIDFIRVDAEGQLVTGDFLDVDNWVGYGAPVVASAGGVVVAAYDGFADQVPTIFPDMSTLSPQENTGNYVVVEHGDGTYGAYFHLKPGANEVTVGDRVETGQLLAYVGNSGGSQAPHLHFEIIDRMPVAAANGLPFAFDSFLVSGFADSSNLLAALEGKATFPRSADAPVAHEAELPLSYVMVDFPED